MKQVVVVAGMARSGTSLMASVLHAMGVRMVEDRVIPPAPGAYAEYEEFEFTDRVSRAMMDKRPLSTPFLTDWFERREAAHQRWLRDYRIAPFWGVKCVNLVLFRAQFEAFLKERGLKTHWIFTERSFRECSKSIIRWGDNWMTERAQKRINAPGLALAQEINRKIEKAMASFSGIPSWTFDFMHDEPEAFVRAINQSLNLDPAWVGAGVSMIHNMKGGHYAPENPTP